MLSRQLYQVGPATGTGFGLAPISWVELRAWGCRHAETTWTPFQAESLMLMSRSYVGEFNDVAREGASTRPFETEDDTRSRPAEGCERIGNRPRRHGEEGIGHGRHWRVLGIEVDARQATAASDALNRLTATGGRAETQTRKTSAAFQRTRRHVGRLER